MKKCWVLLNWKDKQKYFQAELIEKVRYMDSLGYLVRLQGESTRFVVAYRVRMNKPKKLIVERRTK